MNFNLISRTSLFLFISFYLLGCQSAKETSWSLNSPDNNILISVSEVKNADQRSVLQYKVERLNGSDTIAVIESSPLGINRKDQQFSENLTFVSKSEVKTIDEKYTMKIGRQTECRNNANELELTFQNDKGSLIQIVFRAYNDGAAFKYVFPEKSDSVFTVTNELTGFKLPLDGKTWMQPYDKPTMYTPSYEKYYENGIAIGINSPNVEGWAFPALFQTNKSWVLISEANLTANYCGVRLEQKADSGLYKIRFPEPKDGEGTGEVNPSSTLPWVMPWRTIIIGEKLAAIFESQLIDNVSDAAIEGDFSWVKPGRSSWSWLTEPNSPKDYAALKNFVDFSAEMGWEYSLVDANWDLMQGGNIEQLVKYANSKNVGILMWYNSGGPNNTVTERPRNIINNAEKRKAEFKKLQAWGVKGVKIDFWQSDKQNMIAQYIDGLKDAAEYHIMVNFHGCTIPRGWSRTYPNLISMESVRGEENYLFQQGYPENAAAQNTILPFTRNVIGPMDYTPVVLSSMKYPHLTTYGHELALTLLHNSGIVHFADNVKSYMSLDGYVKDFIKTLPVVFDETHYVSGEPGKDVIIASRKGNVWYVAGVNGEKMAKQLTINLPFITSGTYNLNIIKDGANAKAFVNEMTTFKAGDKLQINTLGNGGFVATISAK